ncbi:hypothetical protein [Mycobacterium sp.]|uniref:hypothetical protein n=1 Tax=Mycobacterium sp. TaxID=1785 RepID=UPI003D6B5F59
MHWIQAKKSHEGDQPIITVKLTAVHDDGCVDIEGDNLELTLWHHAPRHLRPALGARAQWTPKYHVLYVDSAGHFNLAKLDQVEPCKPPIRRRPTETTRQFIERAMRDYHGYTVPERWLADLDAIPDGDTGEPQSGYLVGTNDPTPHEKALLRKLAEEFGGRPPVNNADDVEHRRRDQPTSPLTEPARRPVSVNAHVCGSWLPE